MVRLNSVQQEILSEIKEKGYCTIETFKKYYTSPITQKANIEKFMLNGLIKEDTEVFGRYVYCGD